MAYLEELLPEFRKGAKIRCSDWIGGFYIQKDGQTVIDHNNRTFHIHAEDTLSDQWELYKELELDWDYIIKNKCLCLFWNNDKTDIDILKYKYTDGFLADCGEIWENCRPVCKNEINFYEDKKDE